MKTIKRLTLGLLLSLLTLTSCTPDDAITDNPVEEPIEDTQVQLNLQFNSNCNIRRTLIVNGVEENLGTSYGSSYIYRNFNQGDVVQLKIQNNGTCNQSNWINEVGIWKWNEGQTGQTLLTIQSCNNCNVLVSQPYTVQ